MKRRPPRSTRTDTLFPYTTLFRSVGAVIEILQSGNEMLREAGYSAEPVRIGSRDALVFESDTVLGFVCVYDSSAELMESWSKDSDQAISTYQFGLRRSGTKDRTSVA